MRAQDGRPSPQLTSYIICLLAAVITMWHKDTARKVAKWKFNLEVRPHVPVLCTRRKALESYQEALSYAPNNKVAMGRSEFCRNRVQNLGL